MSLIDGANPVVIRPSIPASDAKEAVREEGRAESKRADQKQQTAEATQALNQIDASTRMNKQRADGLRTTRLADHFVRPSDSKPAIQPPAEPNDPARPDATQNSPAAAADLRTSQQVQKPVAANESAAPNRDGADDGSKAPRDPGSNAEPEQGGRARTDTASQPQRAGMPRGQPSASRLAAAAASQSSRSQVATPPALAAASPRPAVPPARTTLVEPQQSELSGVPSREPLEEAKVPLAQPLARLVPPKTVAKGTTGTAPSGETPSHDAAPVADSQGPHKSPDAPESGVKIFTHTDARQAEQSDTYTAARRVEVKFSQLCSTTPAIHSEAQPTVVAQAAPDAASAQRREDGSGDSAGRDRGTRGYKADAKTAARTVGRFRGAYYSVRG